MRALYRNVLVSDRDSAASIVSVQKSAMYVGVYMLHSALLLQALCYVRVGRFRSSWLCSARNWIMLFYCIYWCCCCSTARYLCSLKILHVYLWRNLFLCLRVCVRSFVSAQDQTSFAVLISATVSVSFRNSCLCHCRCFVLVITYLFFVFLCIFCIENLDPFR